MAIIKPFAALRPARDKAAQVSAPSYDSSLRELSLHEIHYLLFYSHVLHELLPITKLCKFVILIFIGSLVDLLSDNNILFILFII